MKVILFGDSELVFDVAENLLKVTRHLIVVENSNLNKEALIRIGVETAEVPDDDISSLMAVGIGRDIDAVFTLYSKESSNVFMTLAVKSVDPAVKVIGISESDSIKSKLLAAGADEVIDPFEVSGTRAYRLVDRPWLEHLLEKSLAIESTELVLTAAYIEDRSPLTGINLQKLRHINPHRVIIIGLVDHELNEQFQFSSDRTDNVLDPGDVLVLMGSEQAIGDFCDHYLLELESKRATIPTRTQS